MQFHVHSCIRALKTLRKAVNGRRDTLFVTREALGNEAFIIGACEDLRSELRAAEVSKLPREGRALRVRTFARQFVGAQRGALDEDTVEKALDHAQRENPFTIDEVWLCPMFLREALLAGLTKSLRKAADLERACTEAEKKGTPQTDMGIAWRDKRARERGEAPAEDDRDTIRRAWETEAALEQNVRAAIKTLRDMRAWQYDAVFTRTCRAENVLRQDPSEAYPNETDASRELTRRALVRLARRWRVSQLLLARTAVRLAAVGASDHTRCIAWYLLGDGRAELGSAVGIHTAPVKTRRARFYRYMPAVIGTSLLIQGLTLSAAVLLGLHWWLCIQCAMMAGHPAFFLAQRMVYAVLRRTHGTQALPRISLENGVGKSGAVQVVIPALLHEPRAAVRLLQKLEALHCAEPDEYARYTLLGDLPDAGAERLPADDEMLAVLEKEWLRVNARFPGTFSVRVRRRTCSTCDARFRGRERKRGALMAFSHELLGDGAEDWQLCLGETLPNARYLLTLDEDTTLPRGGLRSLVGVALHPLQRVSYGPRGERTWGAAVLQPRMRALQQDPTNFAVLGADGTQSEPYAFAVSDVYQDLFGQGTYTGKGLVDIAAFVGAVEGHVPDDAVLSHDLLEGELAGCTLVTDTVFYDPFPDTYTAFLRREHRWIRGDWQLLPWWIGKRPYGEKNPLHDLSRWKIGENFMRSLLPASLLSNFVSLVLTPQAWLGIVPTLIFLLLDPLRSLVRLARYGTRMLFPLRDTARTILQALWRIACLPADAYIALDAIVRTLRRLAVHMGLLDWTTSSQKGGGRFFSLVSFSVPCLLAGAALLAFALLQGRFCVTALLFLLQPLLRLYLERPASHDEAPLDARQKADCRALAGTVWRYFTEFATKDTHFLPPDNVQWELRKGAASRTSPTNIGMALLAEGAAFDLGFQTEADAAARLVRILRTVDSLEKWEGNLYNWIDIRTLKPLAPVSVSSVDSGNLAACLVATEALLRDFDGHDAREGEALCRKLIENMRLDALYDPRRRLFAVSVDAWGVPSGAWYDLLASETRLLSFTAIALGQVPKEHWSALARPLRREGKNALLLSWSGTLFEYLLPSLLCTSGSLSLLGMSEHAVIRSQQRIAAKHGLPWGVSESGYYAFDENMFYQYYAFGIPQNACRSDAFFARVVAPYASAMALPIAPQSAWRNLERFLGEGRGNDFGLYEALDYTPSRLAEGRDCMEVRSHMAHHQGMFLTAAANALADGGAARRFMDSPRIAASAHLLEEAPPHMRPHTVAHRREDDAAPAHAFDTRVLRRESWPPQVQTLSNGRTCALVSERGGVRFMRDGIEAWRFSRMPNDVQGPLLYLRERGTSDLWTAGRLPGEPVRWYRADMDDARVSIARSFRAVDSRLEICLPPETDTLLLRLTVINRRDTPVLLDTCLYAEPTLMMHRDHEAHPAFAGLFIESERAEDALVFTRRPRDGEKPVFLAVAQTTRAPYTYPLSFETRRDRFLGRGGTCAVPEALLRDAPLSGGAGAVLDPCLALLQGVRLLSGERCTMTYAVSFGDSKEDAAKSARAAVSDPHAFDLAAAYARARLLQDGVSPKDAVRANIALADFFWQCGQKRAAVDRRALFAAGLSGENPLLLMCVRDRHDLPQAESLARVGAYLARCGVETDIVFLRECGGYFDAVRDRLARGAAPSAVRVLDVDAIPEETRGALFAAADVLWNAPRRTPQTSPNASYRYRAPVSRLRPYRGPIVMRQSLGGFDPRDGSYIFTVRDGTLPPAPWCNILANDVFGTLVSDRGSGYTWCGSCSDGRITPWTNDPVADPCGEAVYIRNTASAESWCVAPGPLKPRGTREVRHSMGESAYRACVDSLEAEQLVFVDRTRPVKCTLLTLTNHHKDACELVISYAVAWCLGTSRTQSVKHIRQWSEGSGTVLCAENTFGEETKSAFMAMPSLSAAAYTDSLAFPGPGGFAFPYDAPRLSQKNGTPIGSLHARVRLRGGETVHIPLLLGHAPTASERDTIVQSFRDGERALCHAEQARRFWEARTGVFDVTTNDAAANLMMPWLLYQCIAARLLGRTGFYQSGGAFGFRDQLQDALALLWSEPRRARALLLHFASRQFKEGDVLHWWHPGPRGVRTRISDDLLFLPFVALRYARVSGDWQIFREEAPYLVAAPLAEHERERYDAMEEGTVRESLYMHCLRAVDRALVTGAHDLPLMGGGDWNDAMNRVGDHGGESVFVAFFLCDILRDMQTLCRFMHDDASAVRYARAAEHLHSAIETHAWDGAWYRRAFYGDGTPLGTRGADACEIDCLVQAWAALSGAADPVRTQTALKSAYEKLVSDGIVRLLVPPFDNPQRDPGYIAGYVRGVRENGGQYTHAALWLAAAFARIGDGDRAFELWRMVQPCTHTDTNAKLRVYRAEPYAIAADVYGAPPHTGRAGWTWYTGSAAWAYVVLVEEILGFYKEGASFTLRPCIPREWNEYRLTYRFGSASYYIRVLNPHHISCGSIRITLDGTPCAQNTVPLADDGTEHEVEAVLRSDVHA